MRSPYKRVGKQKILDELFNTKINLVNAGLAVDEELTYLFEAFDETFSHSKEKAVNVGVAIAQAFLFGKEYQRSQDCAELRRPTE